jgi:putative N6-adenine-specific DNA methylase
MDLYKTKNNITITCPKRLTPYLRQEVLELGFEIEDMFVTGVRLFATINDCIKLNLNLRCASQVLYSLKQFEANDADAIYSNVVDYPWEDILPDPGYFSITSNVSNDSINNSMYANLG